MDEDAWCVACLFGVDLAAWLLVWQLDVFAVDDLLAATAEADLAEDEAFTDEELLTEY